LVLKNVTINKDVEAESRQGVAGAHWADLETDKLPPCVNERAGFMSSRPYFKEMVHPYSDFSPIHKHFRPTMLNFPEYSAPCIPFDWMLRERAEKKAEELELAFDVDLEDRAVEGINYKTAKTWVQPKANQLVQLDTFFSAIRPDSSLCFFYAKQIPEIENGRRVLIGIGRVTKVGPGLEYEYGAGGDHRAMLWERIVHHSIRPNGKDGFLFPYHELLKKASSEPDLDLEQYIAFAPDSAWSEFSYGSEHVSHDSAIATLLTASRVLERLSEVLSGPWEQYRNWIDGELDRLWKLRGPFPGLGTALNALGIQRGNLLAQRLALKFGESSEGWPEDPWDIAEKVIRGELALDDGGEDIATGSNQRAIDLSPDRKALIRLLSRFELDNDQAERYFVPSEREKFDISVSDEEIVANPYRLYEADRRHPAPFDVATIDRGLFTDKLILERFPIPSPSAPDGPLDPRRIRALMIARLEEAAGEGHTLLPSSSVLQSVRDRSDVQPECKPTPDVVAGIEGSFAPYLEHVRMADGSPAYQLDYLSKMGGVIRKAIERRMKGARIEGDIDFAKRLAAALDASGTGESIDEFEQNAREEKVEALAELYASRFSVLVGPAGTGKTTLLKVLCSSPEVAAEGVLLLAPTGKARVRMEQQTGISGAQTIAQFLSGSNRYDGNTGRYLLNEGAEKYQGAKTVVIDEASMLTEEQLGAVIDALKAPKRLILVGDPRQLPPIGTGRPFVDIIRRLRPDDIETKFPRVSQGFAELTVNRRQKEDSDDSGITVRDDIMLAGWFSGEKPAPASDEIWAKLEAGVENERIRTVQWSDPEDLEKMLLQALVEEIPEIENDSDQIGFGKSIGGSEYEGRVYFRNRYKDDPGAATKAEDWQILSPVHGHRFGVESLNRFIQRRFRAEAREFATSIYRKIPRPMGAQEIVYGDKVINLRNHHKNKVFPPNGALKYVANGEIGIAVGQYKGRNAKYKGKPWALEVEFATQRGFKYSYTTRDFSEEKEDNLALAYALTVHKTQGSEFGTTFLILPENCRLLSRELLYTAVTRQFNKVIILHEGPLLSLRDFSSNFRSETARRITNLFSPPELSEHSAGLFERGLIHTTEAGEAVRSKSEVIIANALRARGVEYEYEHTLNLDGQLVLPDFTIEDEEMGRTIYWEHLGMLADLVYKRRWQAKLEMYRQNGIELYANEKPSGPRVLVVTEDDPVGGIDSSNIGGMIDKLFGT
jgi:ATP-dependent exoDNAse (exonuclease V) alpha subunit